MDGVIIGGVWRQRAEGHVGAQGTDTCLSASTDSTVVGGDAIGLCETTVAVLAQSVCLALCGRCGFE